MIVEVYIGNDRLDLFEDESIKIQSSILSSQDISKVTGDFSKSFTVPSTDKNNNIFKHYYNANIDNSFDARTKQEGKIELGGLPFKRGKFTLTNVEIKQGVASHYTVLFVGKIPNIKDAVGNDELSVLDFSEFDHTYNSNNVKLGLKSQLFDDKLIYIPLVKSQYYYKSNIADQTDTLILKNIAYNGSGQTNGMSFRDFNPAVKMSEVVKAITVKYGFTFSPDFFDRVEFQNLYLWLNNKDTNVTSATSVMVDFIFGSTNYFDLTTNIGSFGFDANAQPIQIVFYTLKLNVTPESGFNATPYKIKIYVNNELESVINGQGLGLHIFNFHKEFNDDVSEVYYEIESEETFSFTTVSTQRVRYGSVDNTYTTSSGVQSLTASVSVSANLPKLKVIDFLKGIFQMFKLIVIPISETDIYVNDIKSYYSQGNLHNITNYIDIDKVEVSRGDLLNEINYKFKEPKTILNQQFKKNTGIAFGDEFLKLEDENGQPLDGDKQEISLPFEQIVYERLIDLQDNLPTNFMYGAILDEDLKKENPEPHLFYAVKQNLGSKTLAFKNVSGAVEELTGVINIPSHTIDFTQKLHSTIFSSEYNEWDGQLITNTLFRNYHDDYIKSLFNIKRRNYKFESILPLHLVTTLKLNDVLKIRDNYFRIDNFQTDLTNGETTLNLINSFDNDLTGFADFQTSFIVDSLAQRVGTYFFTKESFEFKKNDMGNDTNWYDVSYAGNNIYIDFNENSSGSVRESNIDLIFRNETLNIKVLQLDE